MAMSFGGISDSDKKIVGTSVNFDRDIDGEPYKHYLARNLKPSIPFETTEFEYDGSKIVMLIIPASKAVVTKYKGQAYIRCSSCPYCIRGETVLASHASRPMICSSKYLSGRHFKFFIKSKIPGVRIPQGFSFFVGERAGSQASD